MQEPKVTITRRGAERLAGGHLWIYRADVEKAPAALEGGDVVPTHAHLRPSWVMAYDLFPVTTIEEKKVLLAEALEEGGILAFAHDAGMGGCRLGEDDGKPVFRESVDLGG